jgi:hypothetical protein
MRKIYIDRCFDCKHLNSNFDKFYCDKARLPIISDIMITIPKKCPLEEV